MENINFNSLICCSKGEKLQTSPNVSRNYKTKRGEHDRHHRKALFERHAVVRWGTRDITLGSADLNAFDMERRNYIERKNNSHKSTQKGHSDKRAITLTFMIHDDPRNRHHRDNLFRVASSYSLSRLLQMKSVYRKIVFTLDWVRCSSLSD